MKKNLMAFNIVFWLGVLILVVDLLTYYTEIAWYFTTLGIVLLFVSVALIVTSYFIRMKK
ncbi:MAG: hypothetical protein KGH55_02385 [Nanoarchaeota archaeon]|nr:hypothetical protein [Nanoarchaeota archaeon]